MVHWFSTNERGTKMAIWNIAHNIGGGMVGPIAILAMAVFADWHAILYLHGFFALAVAGVILLAVRDAPQSMGLPTIDTSGLISRTSAPVPARVAATTSSASSSRIDSRVPMSMSPENGS